MAQDLGFFKKNGLNVSLSDVGGTAQTPALLAGELQVGALGANEVVHADLAGASLVMVATESDYPVFSLYANKKYKTVQDLVGQTIGITKPGSATDATAHLFLGHFNLLGKVKIAPTGTVPAILAAMSKNIVAGGILSPPTTARAAQQGYVELINGVKLGVPMNHAGIAVTRAYLKAHPNVVKSYLKAYQEGWTFCANPANKQQVVKSVAKYTKSNTTLASDSYVAMLPVWQGQKVPTVNPQAVAAVLKLSSVAAAKTAKPAQFIDNSILQSVQ